MNNANLAVCFKCPHVQPPPYAGRADCTLDGRDTKDHAATGDCLCGKLARPLAPPPAPAPRPATVPGLPIQHIPDDYDPERERRRMVQGGCCGSPGKAG